MSIYKEDRPVFNTVKMIDTNDSNGEFAFEIASIILKRSNNCEGLGIIKDYQVKIYSDEKKPATVSQRKLIIGLMVL